MTRLLGPKDLFAESEFQEILSPLVEPETATDKAAIDQLLLELEVLSNRPTTNAKMGVLLSSFLLQAQRLQGRRERKGEDMIIGYPHDEVYWRKRSSIGYKVAEKLREALVQHGWMTHQEDATIDLYGGTGNCNGYLIADFVPEKAAGLSFQSTEMIYTASTSAQPTKLNDEKVDSRMKAIWAIWKEAPLTFGNQKMSTASRRFNNASLTSGGRMYGPWTTMKQKDRLKCTIDGEPVAEVDVSGMHLTLLFSITGKIPFSDVFVDPYQPTSLKHIDRSKVKAVINSAIGGGTRHQTQPTKMIQREGINQGQLTEIRRDIIPTYECLEALKKDELYSETLAWHETEIMMRLVERLQKPIFILHDCLICQEDMALEVGEELQREYVDYCREQGWTPVAPAFSIDRHETDTVYVNGYLV